MSRRRKYVRAEVVERMDAELRARMAAIEAGIAERARVRQERARNATPEVIESIWADEVQRALPDIDALQKFVADFFPDV